MVGPVAFNPPTSALIAPVARFGVKFADTQGNDAILHRRMENCDHVWDKSYKAGTPQEKAKVEADDLAMELLRR
ncbi:hypothetical protein HAV15_011149 [Penicillium sp. str. |nr:hypothetical protein HAV15_011149 [Penicillium sp. str. \